MVNECKQSKTTPITHVKKKFSGQNDGLKAWRGLDRYCVCPGSYPKYVTIEIWQSNRIIHVAIMTLTHLHNYPLAVLLQCSALQLWCHGQRCLLLAKKGNSQTTHGSIVLEWELNVCTEKVKNQRLCCMKNGIKTSLTYWGRDEMVAILQMKFSNAFYWIKMWGCD